jgi:hypothetical protein
VGVAVQQNVGHSAHAYRTSCRAVLACALAHCSTGHVSLYRLCCCIVFMVLFEDLSCWVQLMPSCTLTLNADISAK